MRTWLHNPYKCICLPAAMLPVHSAVIKLWRYPKRAAHVLSKIEYKIWNFLQILEQVKQNKSNLIYSKHLKQRNWSCFLAFFAWLLLTNDFRRSQKGLKKYFGCLYHAVWHDINTPSHQSKSGWHCVRKDTLDAYSRPFTLAPGVTQTVLKTESEPTSPASRSCVWWTQSAQLHWKVGRAVAGCWFACVWICKNL